MVNLKNTILSLLLLTFLISCGKDPIYLENGTIKCKDTPIGMEFFVEEMKGNVTVVDREMLEKLIKDRGDLQRVCTSNITDMGAVWNPDKQTYDIKPLFLQSVINQDISKWDVSSVTNMSFMFQRTPFNQPISNWDVSNVTDMEGMFALSSFNQPIGNWDVGNVTNMSFMFQRTPFNQPISNWDVSNVTSMEGMFQSSEFNQPIGNWDVSNVTNMNDLFWNSEFNQPIGNWDVSNVTDMTGMFRYYSEFNQPIGNWDVSNVTDMEGMFGNSRFNQPINNWCMKNLKTEPEYFSVNSPLTEENKPKWGTCPEKRDIPKKEIPIGSPQTVYLEDGIIKCKNIEIGSEYYLNELNSYVTVVDREMLREQILQNGNVQRVCTSNITDMGGVWNADTTDYDIYPLFYESDINQPISNWDVSNVTSMERMFQSSEFNQPIGNWDVSNVTNMYGMFYESDFNFPINGWCVNQFTSEPEFFSNDSPLTEENKPKWGTCPSN